MVTTYIIGIDEVGRGSLAGSVYTAGVLAPINTSPIAGVGDSKAISPRRRQELHDTLVACDVIRFFVASETAKTIDDIGIAKAVQRCFEACAHYLFTYSPGPVQEIRIDGSPISGWPSFPCPTRFLPKGDATDWAIGAASIIAKVKRDAYMRVLHGHYPVYDWQHNVGYGTDAHTQAIQQHGLSPEHRRSFCRRFTKEGPKTRQDPGSMESVRQRYNDMPLLDLTDLFDPPNASV